MSSSTPVRRRNRLKELLDGSKKVVRVQYLVREIVFDASSSLPDAFEDEFGVFGFSRVGGRSVLDEVGRDLSKKYEESPE